MDTRKLEQFTEENKLPKFRLGQIQKAIFQDGVSSFAEISTLPKDLREKMQNELQLLSFEPQKVLVSKNNDSMKVLLKLADGNLIETVLISPKPGTWSACISCQVGCAMGCRFCATGKMGFGRNLTAEEITDQILFWRQYLKRNNIEGNFSNIVYMGMGEPFLNWENVSESIRNLIDDKLFGFGSRSLSVSTSGITEGIAKLAAEFPQVNLAISLHFATDEQRSSFMPVNKRDDMESLKNALRNYFELTNRKVFMEYILLEGLNDRAIDAKNLASYLKSIGHAHLLHVNLIRYNTTSDIFMPSRKERAQTFKKNLLSLGINATIRKSLGDEIAAACGQLAGK
ncbi:MAG TPA: 23S rRNA (adenine(2503)-C(2))-methyltransferase RlmN [Patescibacteria group bacterium]